MVMQLGRVNSLLDKVPGSYLPREGITWILKQQLGPTHNNSEVISLWARVKYNFQPTFCASHV